MKRGWLAPFTWDMVVDINRQLCASRAAFHGPTSDGFHRTRERWEQARLREMSLADATDVCRQCHRLAPFCNYNGNTFVAIIRTVIKSLALPSAQEAIARSLAGHIVAGTATAEEEVAFAELLDAIFRRCAAEE